MSDFLVTGATGNVGSAVVRALVAAGHQVRAVSRRPPATAWPSGVRGVTADLDRPETLAAPLAGTAGAFLMSGYADMPGLLSQVRRAGVERVALLSSSSVPSGDMDNAVTAYHILSERAVEESGVAWTFLRPFAFMSNALTWVDQLAAGDVVRLPFPDVPAATVDPDDVGAVAATALSQCGHDGVALHLSGPQTLLPADRVRILGDVLGRDLRVEGMTEAEARADLDATMPAAYAAAFIRFYVDRTLDESPVLPTVRDVLGRAPRSFATWAAAHAGAFSSSSSSSGHPRRTSARGR